MPVATHRKPSRPAASPASATPETRTIRQEEMQDLLHAEDALDQLSEKLRQRALAGEKIEPGPLALLPREEAPGGPAAISDRAVFIAPPAKIDEYRQSAAEHARQEREKPDPEAARRALAPLDLVRSAKATGNCCLFFGNFLEDAPPAEIELLGELLYARHNCGGVLPVNVLFAVVRACARQKNPDDDFGDEVMGEVRRLEREMAAAFAPPPAR